MAKITRVEQAVPTIKTKKQVAAYARISMESERMNQSLSAQISYYSSLIQKNPDWQYAGVFADDGVSGTGTAKRDEFRRMVKAAENGEIVAAMVESEVMDEGEATLKRIFYEDGRVRLQPENSTMEPIYADRADVLGKLVALIRQF